MTEERTVWVEGRPYPVVLSDEREALLAAQAAGRAVVGVGSAEGEFLPAPYLVESPDAADEGFLKKAACRRFGLPLTVAETERLIIREFAEADAENVPAEPGDGEADRVFSTPELLRDYIRCQYGVFGYGIWAVTDRTDGTLVGKAGIVPSADGPELGYHIFEPYRRRGYAVEACLGILRMLREETAGVRTEVRARTDPANTASVRVLLACGFQEEPPGSSVYKKIL